MKVYSKEEVIQQSSDYFNGDKLAAEVFATKYSMRNRDLKLLEPTPEHMHRRLAREFARAEKKFPNPMGEDEIFSYLDHFGQIIPQGSPIFGMGNPHQIVSLSNCFVIETMDSYGGICQADERIVQISKRRGGIGLDISPLRPRGERTHNSALTTDGICIFMRRFSNSSREVGQNGRRGALLLSISVHHPEVLNFIHIKRDLKEVTGANISVRVTDEFMEAVKKNRSYEQRWPVDSEDPVVSQKVKAREVWAELIQSAHLSAEPGVLFWDTIKKNSPADCYSDLGFSTTSTNPCGELPLCPLDSCRLMAINLTAFVDDPFTPEAKFNTERFRNCIHVAQRLSDDLVELELKAINGILKKIRSDPEGQNVKSNEIALWKGIKEKCKQGRRTGLGITGLGDCLAMMGLIYGSEPSVQVVKEIYEELRNETYTASIELAKERGSFPIWDASLEQDNEYLNRLPDHIRKEMNKHGRRNIGCLTTAPAGSISVEAQCSSGFEPVFKAKYIRKRKLTENDTDKPDFIDEKNGDKYKTYEVEHHGLRLFKEVTGKEFEDSPYFGAEAETIDFFTRVSMQALATQYVDHAISSTINLPEDVDLDTVSKIYMQAWQEGCKGLTVFRQGSRASILSDNTECEDCDESKKQLIEMLKTGVRPQMIIPSSAPKRPDVLSCDIHRSTVGGGDWLFFVSLLENGQPYEIFGGDSSAFVIPHKYKQGWIRKNGKVEDVTQYNLILGSLEDENERMEIKQIANTFNNYQYGAFTRLASLTMRHGTPIKYVCEQITKKGVEGDLFSFQRAMSRVLKKYVSEGEKSGMTCPECGSDQMIYKGGCPECKVCGHSACA